MTILINNSITKRKEEFKPLNVDQITWYACGPTVYDLTHLGHARNYLGTDIIRRILMDYFNYDVKLVMNITDIDDKIINKSKEQGISCKEVATEYEEEFFDSMAKLGVMKPSVIVRVCDYMEEIQDFIKKIKANGYAYESNGSIYFDTEAFEKKHIYGKLLKTNKQESLDLTTNQSKKNPRDFALWKKSEDEANSFDFDRAHSGRPGWHIECSAMAYAILGDQIDIHSGGIDLKGIHHNNEIAQMDAYMNTPEKEWVQTFMHSGHLHIEGLKMSKSLKNFISIRDILKTHKPRQIRLYFASHHYDTTMNYSESGLASAVDRDKMFDSFFHNIHALLDQNLLYSSKWSIEEFSLDEQFTQIKQKVDKAMRDNFNTPHVLILLQKQMNLSNVYLQEVIEPSETLIRSITDYLKKILGTMGLEYDQKSLDRNDSKKYIDSLVKFRDEIRLQAKTGKISGIYKLCDELRDQTLNELGIKLEDGTSSNNPTKWFYQ